MLRSPPDARWRSSSILPSSSASGFSKSRKYRIGAILIRRSACAPAGDAWRPGVQPRDLDMGIDLRRRDVGMAEHRLHAAQIGAVIEEMAGEGMPQHMRRQPRRIEPGLQRQRLEELAAAAPRQMPLAPVRGKEEGRGLALGEEMAAHREILGERGARRLAQRHEPLLVALAADDEEARIAPCRGERQSHELRDAQARAVEQFGHGAEPLALGPGPLPRLRRGAHRLRFRAAPWAAGGRGAGHRAPRSDRRAASPSSTRKR